MVDVGPDGGRTQNALLQLRFRAHMFRPGFVEPVGGVVSRTRLYRAAPAVTGPLIPLIPLFRRIAANAVDGYRQIGRAMVAVAASAPEPASSPPGTSAPPQGDGRTFSGCAACATGRRGWVSG